MAKVLGKSGRYVSDVAVEKRLDMIVILIMSVAFCGFVVGYNISNHEYLPISIVLAMFSIGLSIYVYRKIDAMEKERIAYRKGFDGESKVADVINNFPDDYHAIHDLSTSFGNLDHVVVGPSGVYIIDTKNWRGVVKADGNGELLLNEKPVDKPAVRNLLRTVMSVKAKADTLSNLNPFIQPVMAFTSAYVEAKWGTTKNVHCITDDKLYDYIVENKNKKKLSKEEITSISQAFLALAMMDKKF
ncbi:MAG: NERD domain-containing protein [Nitrospirae bacterium]|nr:NERD domain-containing protein [Nitrospirota bacterium]